MDETLTRVSLDSSNRPYLVWKVVFSRPKLGEMDTESATVLAMARDAGELDELQVPEELHQEFQQSSETPLFRVDATVVNDNVRYLRRRWVHVGEEGADGLPWRFFRTEGVAVVPVNRAVGGGDAGS